MSAGIDLDQLNREPELVALAAVADDLFSFMNRQVTVPASCVALLYGDTSQPNVLSAGQVINAGQAREGLFVRSVPCQLAYPFEALHSRDGFAFACLVRLSVQIVPDRTELEAFRRHVLGSRRDLHEGDLRRHCEEAVRSAVSTFVGARPAAELVDPETWEQFDAVLAEKFKSVGFESGLALGRDPRIKLRSTAFEDSQAEARLAALRTERDESEHQRREAASKARAEHLKELGEMLGKVQAMARESGDLSVPELIKTFDVGQRGRLYHGLMAMDRPDLQRTRAVLVVAGSHLLWFDPSNLLKPDRDLKLPKDAGALRSVRLANEGDAQLILVGARHGVHVLREDGDEVSTYLLGDQPEVRGGVNSAALLGDCLYATHSEIGLIEWQRDKQDQHSLRLVEFTEGGQAVRDLQVRAGHNLWFTVDDMVLSWKPGDEDPVPFLAPSVITSMQVGQEHVYAGLKDGSVVRWLIGDAKNLETVRTATGVTVRSIDWLGGAGVPRLLIGDTRPHLDLHVLGDSYHGEYRCFHELRWGYGGDDIIVGVSEARDYLFVWGIDAPESPRGSLSVRRMTGRSIQDIALL